MSISIDIIYEVEDKASLEMPEYNAAGLLPFLQYFPHSSIEEQECFKESVLCPSFVPDFAMPDESADEEDDVEVWEEMPDDGMEYIGPSFDGEELFQWANAWLELIGSDEQILRALVPLTEDGFDWAPSVIEDLKKVIEQGECAKRHNVRLHIEIC